MLLSQLTDFLGFTPEMGGVPNAVWPAPIVKALSVGVEEGAGLRTGRSLIPARVHGM